MVQASDVLAEMAFQTKNLTVSLFDRQKNTR